MNNGISILNGFKNVKNNSFSEILKGVLDYSKIDNKKFDIFSNKQIKCYLNKKIKDNVGVDVEIQKSIVSSTKNELSRLIPVNIKNNEKVGRYFISKTGVCQELLKSFEPINKANNDISEDDVLDFIKNNKNIDDKTLIDKFGDDVIAILNNLYKNNIIDVNDKGIYSLKDNNSGGLKTETIDSDDDKSNEDPDDDDKSDEDSDDDDKSDDEDSDDDDDDENKSDDEDSDDDNDENKQDDEDSDDDENKSDEDSDDDENKSDEDSDDDENKQDDEDSDDDNDENKQDDEDSDDDENKQDDEDSDDENKSDEDSDDENKSDEDSDDDKQDDEDSDDNEDKSDEDLDDDKQDDEDSDDDKQDDEDSDDENKSDEDSDDNENKLDDKSDNDYTPEELEKMAKKTATATLIKFYEKSNDDNLKNVVAVELKTRGIDVDSLEKENNKDDLPDTKKELDELEDWTKKYLGSYDKEDLIDYVTDLVNQSPSKRSELKDAYRDFYSVSNNGNKLLKVNEEDFKNFLEEHYFNNFTMGDLQSYAYLLVSKNPEEYRKFKKMYNDKNKLEEEGK